MALHGLKRAAHLPYNTMPTPTQAQLDARLNPTPVNLLTGQNGQVWRADNPNNGIYAIKDGTLYMTGLSNIGGLAGNPTSNQAGIDYLKSIGIDYNSIPVLSDSQRADIGRTTGNSGYSNVVSLDKAKGTLNNDYLSFFNPTGVAAQTQTVNNTPNTIDPNAIKAAGLAQDLQLAFNKNQNVTTTLDANGNITSSTKAPLAPAPSLTTISNPVQAPTSTGQPPAPTLPTPQGLSTSAQNVTGLASGLDALKATLQTQYDKSAADVQTKIAALTKEQDALKGKEDAAMGSLKTTTDAETAEKRAALDLEKQRVDENYNANQALVGELDGLLSQGNAIIQQMQGTTGLASIMNPRIAKTMSDVQARAGVIQAVISARNGQIGVAQNQLQSTLSAVTSIYGDQLDYYKGLVDYYDNQKDEKGNQIISLDKDKKAYLDAKIGMIEDDVKNAENNVKLIQEAMLDPDKAKIIGQAGVSITDSPATIAKKLSDYDYSQELVDMSNEMATKGYSAKPIAGVTPVTLTDSKGVTKSFYEIPSKTSTAAYNVENPTRSGTLVYTAKDKSEDSSALEQSRGSDGFADPTIYLNLYNAWVKAGGNVTDFMKEYPPANYINPANTWLPSYLKPKSNSADLFNSI